MPGHDDFWSGLDVFVGTGAVEVDRPRGTRHPRQPQYQYPLDYGHVKESTGGDGQEVDVWLGSGEPEVTGVFCTFDPYQRNAELKVLWGVTPSEKRSLVDFYAPQPQSAVLVPRAGRAAPPEAAPPEAAPPEHGLPGSA